MSLVSRLILSAALLSSGFSSVAAQSLPVSVDVAGNTATIRIGAPTAPLADLTLMFDDASGLTPAALGVSADWVNPTLPSLQGRLPGNSGVAVPSEFPLMVTIEPPALAGLNFRRVVHVELHTHALAYTAGSRYRLMKAPLGGAFRDITGAVLPGSVRTRGTTGGFSQFLVVLDARPTPQVINEKLSRLRMETGKLSASEAAPLNAELDSIDAAIQAGQYSAALESTEAMRQRVAARAGLGIPQQWRASGGVDNVAGELLAGTDTLAFSLRYLLDHGD